MKLSIIGLGLSFNDLTEEHLSIIGNADALAGGSRHLNCFTEFTGEKVLITKDLKGLFEKLKQLLVEKKKVVVIASGDPLFYGIGSYLSKQLGNDNVKIFPNINSVAGAFSRINESWHDAKVISLHGRNFKDEYLDEFKKYDKLAVLTGGENTPGMLSEILSSAKLDDFNICVMESLGDETETIEWFSPKTIITKEFSEPNIMIFIRSKTKQEEKTPPVFPGMPEDFFQHESGLITKSEVRVVSLSKLMPESNSIMWDLGAGSGSISIEASYYIKTGQIYAVEKNEKRINQIKENQKHFQVNNLKVVQGVLPDAIKNLPDPDRIFIGGGGVNLVPIIKEGAKRLLSRGRIVINTVLLKNMASSLEILEELGFETEIIQMQINYGHKMPWNQMLKSHNPVWIIQGIKKP